MSFHQIIKRPIVTEKSTILSEQGIYSFVVDMDATKPEIERAIEKAFEVKVAAVRTTICRDRVRRKGNNLSHKRYWKKAMVKLQPGQKISLFEGA